MEDTPNTDYSSAFGFLEGHTLCAVTFIWDYFQLLIGTEGLSIYSQPLVEIESQRFTYFDPGYRDALCALIGCEVRATTSNDNELIIEFDNRSKIVVSFRPEDRIGDGPESLVASNDQGNILVIGDSIPD